jgi:hypothetical protein
MPKKSYRNGGKPSISPHTPHPTSHPNLPITHHYTMSRRSLPRRAKTGTVYTPSLLQIKLFEAIDSPGGVHKTFTLLQKASDDDL